VSKNVLALLDDELSHVELHNDQGTVRLIQKNIYTGARVEIKEVSGGLFEIAGDDLEELPLGLRTADFKALFSFVDTITFYLQKGHWLFFKDHSNTLQGILSTCIYDELSYISKSQEG